MEEKYCPMTRSECVGDLCEWFMEDLKSGRGGMCSVYYTALMLIRDAEMKQSSNAQADEDFTIWT